MESGHAVMVVNPKTREHPESSPRSVIDESHGRWENLAPAILLAALVGILAPFGRSVRRSQTSLIANSAARPHDTRRECISAFSSFSGPIAMVWSVISRIRVVFSLSNSRVAKVGSSGADHSLADGKAVLTARFDRQSITTRIDIAGSQQVRPSVFPPMLAQSLPRTAATIAPATAALGKAGFKLSINAMYPRDDYKWIVEGGTYQVLTADTGPKVPRINLKDPGKSLSTNETDVYRASRRRRAFKVGSRDYETILNWIRSGAPFGAENSEKVQIERLEVFPQQAVLRRARHASTAS